MRCLKSLPRKQPWYGNYIHEWKDSCCFCNWTNIVFVNFHALTVFFLYLQKGGSHFLKCGLELCTFRFRNILTWIVPCDVMSLYNLLKAKLDCFYRFYYFYLQEIKASNKKKLKKPKVQIFLKKNVIHIQLHASSFQKYVLYEVVLLSSISHFWAHLMDNICSTQKIQKSVQLG